MSEPIPRECAGCLGAPAEVAVWMLYAQPILDRLLSEPYLSIGLVTCPQCGHHFLNLTGDMPFLPDDHPKMNEWLAVSPEEAQRCRGLSEDELTAHCDQLAKSRPRLIYDDLGERWEKTHADRLIYRDTQVFPMDQPSPSTTLPIALDVIRMVQDGIMQRLYPQTNRYDAIGVIGCDKIYRYAANPASRTYLRSLKNPPRLFIVYTTDITNEPETQGMELPP